MPTVPNDLSRRGSRHFQFPRRLATFSGTAGAIFLGTILACSSCKRPSAETRTEPAKEKEKAAETARAPSVKSEREVYAVWYEVPADSLAKRRAGKDELTAAHNHLPLGTRVRVTHLKNGRSVIVRITDRGITNRHASIDLCKEAATELDMLREGIARVRLEVLSDDKNANAAADPKATSAQP